MAHRKEATGAEEVEWLERDQSFVEGLDHLGILVVSTNIYARLLPGISNLTERARYFSFYPWVFQSFVNQAADHSPNGWRTWVRRHELALSAAGTAVELKDFAKESSGGLVGARAARRLLKNAGEIDLGQSAALPGKGTTTYFGNQEGGYAQYYKGSMTELGLLKLDEEHKAPDRQLTLYAGVKLAKSLEPLPGFRKLQDLAKSGARVSQSELVSLGRTVHPGAIDPESEEASLLRSLLLGDDLELCAGQRARARIQRRHSFVLALDYLAQGDEDDWSRPEWGFRWAVLEGRLGDGREWRPEWLRDTRLAWAAYSQSELFNYALECLLWSVLQRIGDEPRSPEGVAHELALASASALDSSGTQLERRALPARLSDAVAAHRPPPDEECWQENGTYQLLDDLGKSTDALDTAARAVRLLLRTAVDRERYGKQHPFATIPGGLRIAKREIHLKSWWDRVDASHDVATTAFFERLLLDWVIYRHLRVATRKLASQGDYTFRMRPEQGVLVKCGDFEPTFTNPRLRQANRIMADVGLIDPTLSVISAHGRSLLEADA